MNRKEMETLLSIAKEICELLQLYVNPDADTLADWEQLLGVLDSVVFETDEEA